MRDLEQQIEEKTKKLDEAEKRELELIKRERELEEAQKTQELEIQRKIREERKTIAKKVSDQVTEEYRLKDMEKNKQISDLTRQIGELKRKAEQGSQKLQGDISEIALEKLLKKNFPFDEISSIAKGVAGADVLQRVFSQSGKSCGTILWESKRTKAWHNKWIVKLKNDQREAKADVAVIVTESLPKDIKSFGPKDGIWVTDYSLALGLAFAFRENLTQVAAIKRASIGKDEKTERLWKYVVSPQFRQRVESIVENFRALKEGLEKEKAAFSRIWAAREQQLQQVVSNTAGLYGDMQGLIGPSMRSIPALEAGEQPEDDKKVKEKK